MRDVLSASKRLVAQSPERRPLANTLVLQREVISSTCTARPHTDESQMIVLLVATTMTTAVVTAVVAEEEADAMTTMVAVVEEVEVDTAATVTATMIVEEIAVVATPVVTAMTTVHHPDPVTTVTADVVMTVAAMAVLAAAAAAVAATVGMIVLPEDHLQKPLATSLGPHQLLVVTTMTGMLVVKAQLTNRSKGASLWDFIDGQEETISEWQQTAADDLQSTLRPQM